MQTKKARLTPSRQAKNKRDTAKTLATLQRNYEKKIRKYLLHLFNTRTAREQLAHWTLICEGKPGSISKIRFEGFETTML